MTSVRRSDLEHARDVFVTAVRAIPDSALDFQRSPSEWTLKEIVAHVAHGNDFYTMVVNEARRSGFGSVRLSRETPDYRAMLATDAAAKRCVTTACALEIFNDAFHRLAAVLDDVRLDDLVKDFALTYEWRPSKPPEQTNLMKRVIEAAIAHMDEHREQISENLRGLGR